MKPGYFQVGPLLLLLFVSADSFAFEWQDLWLTQDQQAEKAFQRQQYEHAAQQFTQPPWKAAAQYKADQYEQVLETLKDTQSSDGFYMKGNAHARLGQFKEALAAYEKALKLDPENADARFNKELIEKELQKQQQEQQQKDSDSEQEQDSKKGDSEQRQESEDGDNPQDRESEGQNQNNDSPTEDSEARQRNAENNSRDQQNQQKEQKEQKQNEQAQASEQSAAEDKPEGDENNTSKSISEALQEDENEQANEQWLKRIPDDPAGLLRRKFKYQYRKRQQQLDQQEEPW